MPVSEKGAPGDVPVLDVMALGAELSDGGVQVAGAPQHHGVEDQAQRGELVLWPSRYAWRIWPRPPRQIARASRWQDSCTVSCRFISRR